MDIHTIVVVTIGLVTSRTVVVIYLLLLLLSLVVNCKLALKCIILL